MRDTCWIYTRIEIRPGDYRWMEGKRLIRGSEVPEWAMAIFNRHLGDSKDGE